MKLLIDLFFVLFVLLLAGCDPAYRIRRDNADINYIVPFDCLMSSIKNTPNIKVTSDSASSPQYVCKDGQTNRQILYSVDKELITLTGCYERDVLKTFSQDTSGWDGGQKSKNVPAILKSMQEVELAIEKRCNVKGFTSEIKNNCIRIDCGS